MPVRMVSVIANCESSPRVKSIAKKRIAHRVGKGNLVIKVIEVIKVIKVVEVFKVIEVKVIWRKDLDRHLRISLPPARLAHLQN